MQLTLSRSVFSLLFLFSFMGQALAVGLAWDANSESNLAGYNVYRSDSSGSGHQRLNSGLVRTTSFDDGTAQDGRTYYYVVTAVNSNGAESDFSGEVRAAVAGRSLIFPASVEIGDPLLSGTFVGMAVLNTNGSSSWVTLSARDGNGIERASMQLSSPLGSGAQTALLTTEIVGSDQQALSIGARADQGLLQGFFMIGDSSLTRLDGVGGLEASQSLYFPFVRQNGNDRTLLFLFNSAGVSAPSVTLTLHDPNGTVIRSISRSMAPYGSLRGTLAQIFGSDIVLAEGFVRVQSSVPLKGFELFAQENDFASLAAQAGVESGRLFIPHFFIAHQGGDTEIRLLNVGSTKAFVRVNAFGNDSRLLGARDVEIDPNRLFVGKVSQLLNLSPGLDPSGTLTGHLELRLSGIQTPKLVGAVTFTGNWGRFLSTLPIVGEGQTETLFLHVAQSDQMGIFTGCSILNPGTETAAVKVEVFDRYGNRRGERNFNLEPGRRVVDLLNGSKFFGAGFNQVYGHFRVSSTRPVISFALFGDSRLEYLSTIEGQKPLH